MFALQRLFGVCLLRLTMFDISDLLFLLTLTSVIVAPALITYRIARRASIREAVRRKKKAVREASN